VIASAITIVNTLWPSAVARITASRIEGKEWKISTKRIRILSVMPPRMPETEPMIAPINSDSPEAPKPTIAAVRTA
jgi:hypothetical protein